ncbi:MAG: transglutaminase family protein [Acidimicrobiales bacterium]
MTTAPADVAIDTDDPAAFLAAGDFVDHENPAVRRWVEETVDGAVGTEAAVRVYYDVRDRVRYDPWTVSTDFETYRASALVTRSGTWCVPKATLFVAGCRAAGVPARVGLADVRNHLASPKLLEALGTEMFHYHGYAEAHVGGRWVRVTPTFNKGLCEKFGVHPAEWDGTHDALFHEFDTSGRRHMTYERYHGVFADVPYPEIFAALKVEYGENYDRLVEYSGGAEGAADAAFSG